MTGAFQLEVEGGEASGRLVKANPGQKRVIVKCRT